ncbi:MAG TPA: glycosyltransferase [Gemmatimonadaceae bacterium]|nr:glycosyltransferase [Gemmatimonadaceae bacterium]
MSVTQSPAAIAAVLPLRNKRPFIDRCLGSVARAAARHEGVEIVVVDNESSDGSLDAPVFREVPARVLPVGARSISAVRNAGAAATTAPILAFIDADCVVPEDFFRAAARILEDPRIDATGCEVRLPDDGSWIERVWDSMHAGPDDGPRHYLNSASFVVRRALFERLGGFDEDLTTGEDTDFCLRLTHAGGRIWGAQSLQVVHLDNPRTLRAFFRKERWRGLGGMTRTILSARSRTAIGLLAFAGALGMAIATLLAPLALPLRLVLALALAAAVPAGTVAYRAIRSRRIVSWAPAILLYFVYYLARLSALVTVSITRVMRWMFRKDRGDRADRGDQAIASSSQF